MSTPETTHVPTAALPASLRLGAVDLTVTDLDRSVAFYQDALGLQLHRREDPVAALGVGEEDLIVLTEEPAARPAGRHAGLYHYALLYPARVELARAAQRLAARRTPIQGASDHGTHEAIYLADPDGNGIELAADRPREQWPDMRNDPYAIGPRPLDTEGVMRLVANEQPQRHAGPGMRMGHLHLQVGDVEQAKRFYVGTLGFEEMTRMPTAGFVSAGGYHHHLAFNVWQGEGIGPAPPGTVGLRQWTIKLAESAEVEAVRGRLRAAGIAVEERPGGLLVRDPWDIAVVIEQA